MCRCLVLLCKPLYTIVGGVVFNVVMCYGDGVVGG